MKPFVEEICEYIAENSARFTFGTGEGNLKIGELTMGVNGVFAIASPSPEPDRYTDVRTYNIDFWAVNTNTPEAFDDLRIIYNLFHQGHDYETDNFYIYFSHVNGQIDDLDRDGENRKLLRVSIEFLARAIIS